MLRRVTIFISLLTIGVILFTSQTYAASHTFSVYGHVRYDDGSSIPGTTIRLIGPISNTTPIFSYMVPAIQSTVTDSQGDFQFVNVTTNYSILGLDLEYPAAHPADPQYVYVGSEIDPVNTSGIQYVNITRISAPNPELPSASSMVGISISIIIFGLVGLFIIRQNKK